MVTAALTFYDALLRLAACQVWIRSGRAKDGRDYGAGRLRRVEDFDNTLKNPGRKVQLRLANMHNCCACGVGVSPVADGDHHIPKSNGGPQDLSNYAPMCSRCNSKKGQKDLLEWWAETGRPLRELHVDVIVAYARVKYNYLADRDTLESAAPLYIKPLLDSFAATLPSPAHIQAFRSISSESLLQLALPI